MTRQMRFFAAVWLIIACAGAALCAEPAAAPAAVPAVATKFLSLFDELRAAEAKTTGRPHISFTMTDAEIDEYMRYSLHQIPRPGLDSVTVKIFPQNYISTFTVLDFDAVEKWHPGTIPGVMKVILNGKKSIWVDYRIQAQDSKITFSVEKAYFQDVRLPALLVQKVMEIVAARQPEKYDISKPMPIPFGLRQLRTTEHTIQGEN